MAIHASYIYVCKLKGAKNVPGHWNTATCILTLLKQSHLQTQPLPTSASLGSCQTHFSSLHGLWPTCSLFPSTYERAAQ